MASPFPRNETRVSPVAYQGGVAELLALTTFGASAAWTRSNVVCTDGQRKLTMFVDYDPAAAAAYYTIIVLGSNGTLTDPTAIPAAGDDVWFRLCSTDGGLTAGVLTGTLATGSDFTVTQPQGNALVYELAIRCAAATAATDEYRQAITIDVAPFKWLHIQVQETVASVAGAITINYSCST